MSEFKSIGELVMVASVYDFLVVIKSQTKVAINGEEDFAAVFEVAESRVKCLAQRY